RTRFGFLPLGVAPVELAFFFSGGEFFGGGGAALGDDNPGFPAVDVGAFHRAIVEVGNTHVGPIDVTRRHIHGDAVGKTAIGDDGLAVGAIRIHRMNAAGV